MFATQLSSGLGERGWRASVVALAAGPEGGARIEVPILSASSAGLRLSLVRALRGEVRRLRPSVVIANGGATLRYAVAAVRGLGRRPRLVYGSIGEPLYWIRNDRHRRLLALQLSLCDRVFAVSRATRSQLVQRLGVAEERVVVTPTGVSPRWLDLVTDPGADPLRLVWIGSLSDEKDPRAALIAFQRAAVPGSTLVFVGDGPLRGSLEAEAPDTVTFVGSVPDVAPHLRDGTALLLSSRTEGLPGVVLEALGSGLPVIATDVGGVRDVVVDGVTGRLVPAGDVDAMATAIESLGSDPHLRRRMGAAGRGLVAESYLLSHSIDRFDAALRDLLTGGPV